MGKHYYSNWTIVVVIWESVPIYFGSLSNLNEIASRDIVELIFT